MFFYLLIFLQIIVLPLATGVFLSLGLREIYLRRLAEEQQKKWEMQENNNADHSFKLYDASLNDLDSENKPSENKPEEIEIPESLASSTEEQLLQNELSDSSTEAASPAKDSLTPESIPHLQNDQSEKENRLKSVFDSQNRSPDMFKINDVVKEMISESQPEIPSDLSWLVESETSPPEKILDQFEMEDKEKEDDESKKTAIKISENEESLELPSDFSNTETASDDQPDIAPMAVELLGKDFNFDTLLRKDSESELDSQPISETKNDVQQQIPLNEIAAGFYQAAGNIFMPNSDLSEKLWDEQEIASSFPRKYVQDTLIEPDISETEKFSFTTESQPMFVRKKRKTS